MGIRLSIKLGEDVKDSVVDVSGYEVYPIDDEMAHEFCGIPRTVVAKGSHDELWGWLANYTGRVPNEFFMSDPVVGSDVVTDRQEWEPFKDRGRAGVRIERVPVSGRVITATGQPKQIGADKVVNPPESLTNQTGTTTLSESVTEESSVTREMNWQIGMEQSIGVEVEGGLEGVAKGKVSRSMTFSFSKGGSESKTRTQSKELSQSRSANYDVPPGKVHEYSLTIGSGSIEVDIDYEYRIIGQATAWYKKPLTNGLGDGAAFDFDIAEWLRDRNRPAVLRTTERLSIGLVSEATLRRYPRDFTEDDRD